ncbi:RING finger and SPRY domain-containing protein 1-like [Culicoides brevitarsis]|uniref:RING finger and SPRY domain-containing protein 1-like n=1 Tax=Culicoides brevitarsis TaxID=469753 RepID=UPI00307C5BCB
MGNCLCKDKTEDGLQQDNDTSSDCTRRRQPLSELIDSLVKETLDVIGSVVGSEPDEAPISMQHLHDLTEKPHGWIELIKSLVRTVPVEHSMGASVITLLMDDSPLPSKDAVMEVADMINKTVRRSVRRERNLCVILGCLAEKLAGPSSIAVLSEATLSYLLGNLDEGINPDIMLFSLIALEKFAQTSENKATIKRKLNNYPENPLVRLERYCDQSVNVDFVMRQVGFCARWCLDNYFLIEGRKYSYETVDVTNVNVMLNTKDVSEYLKISPDGLEARCDAYSFESVRCTFQVNEGCWYYEVLIITPGVMQIGWATKNSNFLSHEGYGIGDDPYSIAFDGCRRLIWYNAKSLPHELPTWEGGSTLGCLIDLDAKEVVFSLNGIEGGVLKQVFGSAKEGFFAAASFMSFQQCRFNFGNEPFKYPPTHRNFRSFNDFAVLKPQDKIVLPRHLFLEQLRKSSVRDDSCTLCFDMKATVRLEPCKHRGFCTKCSTQLQQCPMCRAEIEQAVQEILDSPTSITNSVDSFSQDMNCSSVSATSSNKDQTIQLIA